MNDIMRRLRGIGIVLVLALASMTVYGQAEIITLEKTAEYDIGFDCPVASALQPGTETLWILMDNCFGGNYSVTPHDVQNGQILGESIPVEAIGDYDIVISFGSPLAFVSDHVLQIVFFKDDSYDYSSVRVDITSGAITTDSENDAAVNALMRQYTEYPESTYFGPGHRLGVVMAPESLHVLELATGRLVFEMDVAAADYSVFPRISDDEQLLYLPRINEPDNYDSYATTLSIYRLEDGTLMETMPLPYPFIYPNSDDTYAAIIIDDSQLGVVDLSSGTISETLDIWEAESRALKCLNNGNDLSDLDFTKSGRLRLADLTWLPDGTSFTSVNSYGGEGAQSSGGVCIFNYSRLRQYQVSRGG